MPIRLGGTGCAAMADMPPERWHSRPDARRVDTRIVRQVAVGLAAGVALLLAGCTSWSAHGVAPTRAQRIPLVVLPVRVTADIRSLRQIVTVPGKAAIPDERARIRTHMAQVTARLTDTLAQGLGTSPWFRVMPTAPPPVESGAAALPGTPPDPPLTAAEARRLGQASGAEAALSVSLAAYGGLSRKWTAWLIGSGIVEGTVQGAVVYGATSSVGAAVLVGGEEIGQEVLTWGGGSYLFNKWFDPVILEASLVSTRDGTTLWTDTVIATLDDDQLKPLAPAERAKREVRLRVTADSAVHDLLGELNGAAYQRYLDNLRPRPGSYPVDD